uniref:phosphoribosyltransferase n=1 Tax=Nocardia farcinica TaxID=37329 RepID=UPI0024577FC0
MPFLDRREAGRRLVERVRGFHTADTVVLGVPRGGVPVAYEVAAALGAPLDVAVVRKLRVPYQPELVFGALGEDGVRVVDDKILVRAFVSDSGRAQVETDERAELARTALRLRGGAERLDLHGRTVVIVDDGVATGATARAALATARARGALRTVLAVPVGSVRSIRALAAVADHVVCLETPEMFHSIGHWYRDFAPVEPARVCDLLDGAAAGFRGPAPPPAAVRPGRGKRGGGGGVGHPPPRGAR